MPGDTLGKLTALSVELWRVMEPYCLTIPPPAGTAIVMEGVQVADTDGRFGLPLDASCLEVGGGRGSIAGWLCKEVAPGGQVTATDAPRSVA